MDSIQLWLHGLPEWETLILQILLTLVSSALGWGAGRGAFALFSRLPFVKKTEAAREGQRAFRWIFSLSGVLIGFAMAVYFIWTLTPRELLALPLVELSDTKQIRVSNLLGALLVFVAARIGIFYFRRLFVDSGGSHRLPMDQGRRLAVFQIGRYIVYLLAILLMLTSLNINLSVLIASSAALFIGIGLALQNTFSDIASGIVILVDRTIEVGDVIMVDSLELEGKVKEIRLRSTIIETLDAMTVIVPNSRFTTTNVVNWSFNDKVTRFRVRVGVAYGSNVQLVRKILVLAAQNHGLILNKPEPKVRFTEFGESSLDFELLFWTSRVMEYQDIKSDLRFKIEADFRKNGIQIPFPQRDLHIVSDFRQQEKESESPVVDGIDMEPKN